jgi:hypothetical protein
MTVVRWNVAEEESKTGDGDDLNLPQDDEQPHGGYPNAIVDSLS